MATICAKYGSLKQMRRARKYAQPPEAHYVQIGDSTYDRIDGQIGVQYIVAEQYRDQKIREREEREAHKNASKEDRRAALRQEHKGDIFQGEIGERIAVEVGVNQLNLQSLEFTKPGSDHGPDGFFRDREGNYVYAEFKCTETKDGTDSLEPHTWGEQASMKDVFHKLELMKEEGSELYSEANAALAQKIEASGSLRRILVHTNPQSLNVVVSEGYGNDIHREGSEGWAPVMAFRFSDNDGKK